MGIKLLFSAVDGVANKDAVRKEIKRVDSLVMATGDTVSAHFLKGVLYSMIKDYPAAINAYDEALEKDERISFAYLNRGTTRYEMDEFVFAEQQYSDMVTISSSTIAKNSARKPVKPDHKLALQDFDEVIDQRSGLPFVYYNRANVKLSLQDFQRAIDDYSMAIRLEPGLAEAYYNRALTLLYLNEEGLACQDLSKAGELGITEAYNVIKRYCGK
jgi:tetratricopeptide (TPR) repeat protein